MLSKIIAFSVQQKLIVALFTIVLIAAGTYAFTQLPIDAVPDITNNQVQVITVAPSYGATDIERFVTFPVEQANSNIAGLHEIRSFSRFGLSLVTLVFHDDVDVYWARQQVAERLQTVSQQIPKSIGTPELGPITTGLGEIYQYAVRPAKGYEDKYDVTELRTIQDWIIRRQLLGVPGVAEVSSFGGKLKQYTIETDGAKLQSFGLTIGDVLAAVERNNQNTGGSYIEEGGTALFIRSEGLISSIDQLELISVKTNANGTPVLIRDIGHVAIGHATRYGAMCYNDEGEVAGAIVMMLKGANSNQVIHDVKERINDIKKTLPEGIIIEPFLDRTKMVNNAIHTVRNNLMEGALIVIFVLVLFLGNWRAGLIVASVIPLAMLFAIILMNIFGVSGNLMSLGALDFGLIVDGAVIIVEAVLHAMVGQKLLPGQSHFSRSDLEETVQQSASKMMSSAVFGQIIILIVYIPLLTLQGIEGKMFKPMAQTVSFALIGAFVLSLTYVPMMTALFLNPKQLHQPNRAEVVIQGISQRYQNILQRVLQFPKLLIGSILALFVVAVLIFSQLGGEFIPALEEGDFAVDTRVLTGSNLNTSIERTQQAVHVLRKRFPEIEKIVTKIGSGEVPTDPMPMEAADMMIIMHDKQTWKQAKTFPEMAEKMQAALNDVPGITTGFQYPVQMRFNELMTGARQDVVCKLFGENLDTLSAYANQMANLARGIEGAKDLYVEPVNGMPQVVVKYNYAALAQYHLSVEEVNQTLHTAFAGSEAGMLFDDEKRFPVVVRLAESARQQASDVANLLVACPNGTQVPLSLLASVDVIDGPNQIQREDAKRRIVVGFNVRGRDVESIVQELQTKMTQQIKLPVGYYVKYGGSFENLNQAKKRLSIAVPIALFLIFLLLYFAFHSVRLGLLIYSAIPLSAIGGVFFLAARGMSFSISAGVGFIALFGVAVLNGIVLISEFDRLKKNGVDGIMDRIIQGAGARFRPVLMTAFVAALGFVPMALSNGAGAEVQRPLATVVIGGLLVATFLTLFVLPCLYYLSEKNIKQKITPSPLVLLLLIVLLPECIQAQIAISLPNALQRATHNNAQIKSAEAYQAYKAAWAKTGRETPLTEVLSEFGQFNTPVFDGKIGVVQHLKFPGVVKQQTKFLQEDAEQSRLETAWTAKNIEREVTTLYYTLLYLNEKKRILLENDSMYAEFQRRAEIRYKEGESHLLEKLSAEHVRAQIQIQSHTIDNQINQTQWAFSYFVGADTPFTAEPIPLKINPPESWLLSSETHLQIQRVDQQIKKQQAQQALLKTARLPEWQAGYYVQSFRNPGMSGIGPLASYGAAGIAMPLLGSSNKKRFDAMQFETQQLQWQKEDVMRQLTLKEKQIRQSLQTQQKTLTYYETTGLDNARGIYYLGGLQFKNGSINYLEWIMLMNQAMSMESDYIDALHQYNLEAIQLRYLNYE